MHKDPIEVADLSLVSQEKEVGFMRTWPISAIGWTHTQKKNKTKKTRGVVEFIEDMKIEGKPKR